jgi:hypothetical protein
METLTQCVACGMEKYTLVNIYICSECLQAEKKGYALECFNDAIVNQPNELWQRLK